ncbi:MAG TPA: hypothetical protein V6C85_29900, partial [Allocoleopsis sp.]
MIAPSKYWEIFVIDTSEGRWYNGQVVRPAKEFFQKQFLELAGVANLSQQQDLEIQAALLSYFRTEESSLNTSIGSVAGLCLRCYISYFIKEACIKLVSQFGHHSCFALPDLLPFVLNDDGRTQLLLDRDGQSQIILDKYGNKQKSYYNFFTFEILRKFDLNAGSSLGSWTHYQTRQNQEIKNFLSEQGIQLLSDWALLNRARPEQLERLGYPADRDLVEVFHAVYRRDRRKQRPRRVRGCPDPTHDQLSEMLHGLRERGASVHSPEDLMRSLKRVAKQLRQYEAPSTEPFEAIDSSTGEVLTKEFPDPQSRNDLDEIEQQELQDFCTQQFLECLQQSVEQGFRDRIHAILKSPRRAVFAPQVKLGLQLLYSQGMSQHAIAQQLGMTQSQVSRLLQPEELLSQVRFLTVEKLLHCILKKAEALGLTTIPPTPDYLSNLMQQLE